MQADDICVLDYDLHRLSGTRKASIEAGMHAAVYQERPDVNVIIHTHQPYASALALSRKPIPALFDEQVMFLGRGVVIVPYGPSGTTFLKRRVKSKLSSGDNAYILANHGVLVLGGDVGRAVHNMALLEKVALDYLLTLHDRRARPPPSRRPSARSPSPSCAATRRSWPRKRPRRRATSPRRARLRARRGTGRRRHRAAASRRLTAAPPAHGSGNGAGGGNSRRAGWRRRPAAPTRRPRRPRRRRPTSNATRSAATPTSPPSTTASTGSCAARCARSSRRPWRSTSTTSRPAARAPRRSPPRRASTSPAACSTTSPSTIPFPIAVEKADGAYLWDADGNRYIDFLQAGGPTVLGSNYAPVRDKVVELLHDCGPVTGLFHEYELKLATLVNRLMPSIEMFRALGSGTESVMAAIRAARAHTGKKYVIKVGGAYHGWSDQMVYGLHVPGTWRFEAKGIPMGVTGRTREVYPNDLKALRRKLAQNKLLGGTAAVIVEPIGPESGTRPVPFEWNAQVRELCDEFGALLIFDEVVTGFRLGLGGAQGYFGVKPDLTVFGKCISGGYPMAGGVGGRADVMMSFASGIGGKSGEHAYVGGTLSANPLSCAAGYFALLEMERTNAPVLAGRAGDRLTRGLNDLITRFGLPYVAFNQGSIVHLETSGVMLLDLHNPVRFLRGMKPRKHMMEEMGAAFMANGLVTLAGSRLYTSMADTDEVIDDALARFGAVLASVEGV